MSNPTDSDLMDYLDEMLPVGQSAEIERQLREDPGLRRRVSELTASRDAGDHSVGQIWRRNRLSCLDRGELGTYLLGVLSPNEADYVEFHLNVIGCRICRANLDDLQAAERATEEQTSRRRRYFESSAGLLRSKAED